MEEFLWGKGKFSIEREADVTALIEKQSEIKLKNSYS
jgi:hypothetical protein